MKNINDFTKALEEKIKIKCKKFHLNPEIIHIKLDKNTLHLQVPGYHTFVKEFYFKGKNKNFYDVLVEADEYLEAGIKQIFTKNLKITDDDFMKEIEESTLYLDSIEPFDD